MAEKKQKEIKDKPVKQMYIGPSIKKYGLNSGTIFEGEHPNNVKAAKEEYPEIISLFINVNKDFPLKKTNVKTPGTKENVLYKAILKKLGGK